MGDNWPNYIGSYAKYSVGSFGEHGRPYVGG